MLLFKVLLIPINFEYACNIIYRREINVWKQVNPQILKFIHLIQEYLVIKSQKSANSLTGNGKTRERESALFFNNLTDYFILVNHRRNTFRSFLFNNKFYYAKIKTDCKYLLFDDNFCITY